MISFLGSLGFPGSSKGKESACNAGDPGSIPGSGGSPGEGHGNPLQYSWSGESQGQRSLGGYSLWGRKESDTTVFLGPWGSPGPAWFGGSWEPLLGMRQERSSRCRALASPRAGSESRGRETPGAAGVAFGPEASAPQSPSVGTLLRSPAARGEGTPAARGGSTARSFCCDPSSRPLPLRPPEVRLHLLSGRPSPPSAARQSGEGVAPAPACPTGLGESFRAPGKSSLRKRAPSARPA